MMGGWNELDKLEGCCILKLNVIGMTVLTEDVGKSSGRGRYEHGDFSDYETYNFNKSGKLDVTMIKNIGNIINEERGLDGFRIINVYPGDYATFVPASPYQIYPQLYSLLDNYYNVWNILDPFMREAMFHINFMRIHPFEDGNKRCAKIILASNLLKSFYAPIIITEEDTLEYYGYINNCDYNGFAEFLKQRSKLEMDTLVSLFKMKYNIPMDETPDVFKGKKGPKLTRK